MPGWPPLREAALPCPSPFAAVDRRLMAPPAGFLAGGGLSVTRPDCRMITIDVTPNEKTHKPKVQIRNKGDVRGKHVQVQALKLWD